MENTEIKQRITKTLDNLNLEQLALVEKLLTEMTAYFKTNKSLENTSETPSNNDDPLAQLRNSDFIGCFSDDPDLSEKSEKIAKRILYNKDSY
ncbi:MAG: hypothetical protein AB4062_10185 [Crocosphaera sp.]